MAAQNGLMFIGFYLINSTTEAYHALGAALIFVAGAWQAVAIARAAAVEARFGVAGLVAAGLAGGALALSIALIIKKSMQPPEFQYEPLAPLEYTSSGLEAPTMDLGGEFQLPMYDMGSALGSRDHGLAVLQRGETVTSKTSNMVTGGGASGITINIHGDVYDGDNFAEKIGEVLPDALKEMTARAF